MPVRISWHACSTGPPSVQQGRAQKCPDTVTSSDPRGPTVRRIRAQSLQLHDQLARVGAHAAAAVPGQHAEQPGAGRLSRSQLDVRPGPRGEGRATEG
eukprot:405481-Hanusia_phi.AAC.1